MKKWKIYQICIFVLLCLGMNVGGGAIADHYQLPLWMDSFGTVLSAYVGGPLCGAMVGVTSNILSNFLYQSPWIYALTSIAIALIVGVAAKKNLMQDMYGTVTLSVQVALVAIIISVPVNLINGNGYTGNIWGDGVINFLRERGYHSLFCSIAGQFYLEFADKFVTLMLLFLCLKLNGWLQRRKKNKAAAVKTMVLLLALTGVFSLSQAKRAAAEAVTERSEAVTEQSSVSAPAPESLIRQPHTSHEKTQGGQQENTEFGDYVQTVFSSDNGLPCGEANDIAQTNDGILWIGTYAGLYRYNGSEFVWMDEYDSVHNVNCLYADTAGRLWIGTNDNGLSIAINERIVNVLDQSTGLPSNSVRCIIEGTDGYVYVGTTGSMQILRLQSGMKKLHTLREINYADSIAADEKGHVATVTNDGRLFLLKEGNILCSLQLTDPEEQFNCCSFDRDGNLLVGGSSNLIYVYDISEGAFREKGTVSCEDLRSLNDLCFLDSGQLFVSTDSGIGYFNKDGTFHRVNVNDFNNSIDNMLMDYQGNLWFTSSRLGLLRLAQSPFRDVYSSIGMESKVVNTIARWRDAYYIGTDKGMDAVDLNCREQIVDEVTKRFEGVRIRCLYADKNGSLWVCTYGQGLVEITADGEEFLYNSENGSFGNRARLATELRDGTIVAAGDTGMSFIRNHRVVHTIGHEDGLTNAMILTVLEMPDGTILAGTDGDGIAVIREGKVEQILSRADGLTSGVILRAVKDPKTDGVFLVTGNGLCYLDEDNVIRALNNFPYFNNYDVWVKDADTLFITGSAGIYVVNRDELLSVERHISYDLLDSRKGLTSALTANSWNYDDGEGDLYLACDSGVFIIDSNRYASDGRAYRMNISTVRLDGEIQHVERSMPILVDRSVGKIEIVPEIINYTIQDPNVGYYLEGFEKDWTIVSQSDLSSIIYTNLPNGNYIFHLAVFNGNRDTILEERTYQLVKKNAIQDNRFFLFYMLIVAMIAVIWLTIFAFRRRMQRMQVLIKVQEKELDMANRHAEISRKEAEVAMQQAQMGTETIMAIAKAVDAKDERTASHSQRVSDYSAMIGAELGMSETEVENLRKAARMHDVGKIGIPDNILNKPARLTDEEYAIMKSHVTRGAEILKDFTLIEHVVEGARFHHERYDGRGYPDGLKGEEIPLYGRIIGVADAFDAMTANRVYRKQQDFGYVLGEMRNGKGTQFDPQMVDILLKLIVEGKIDLRKLYPEMNKEGDES